MRHIIRFIFCVAGVLLTIQAFLVSKNGFGNGYTWIQGQALEWWIGAVVAWCIFWWAGQQPK